MYLSHHGHCAEYCGARGVVVNFLCYQCGVFRYFLAVLQLCPQKCPFTFVRDACVITPLQPQLSGKRQKEHSIHKEI